MHCRRRYKSCHRALLNNARRILISKGSYAFRKCRRCCSFTKGGGGLHEQPAQAPESPPSQSIQGPPRLSAAGRPPSSSSLFPAEAPSRATRNPSRLMKKYNLLSPLNAPALRPQHRCPQTQYWNLDMLTIPTSLDHEEKLEFTEITMLCAFL